jgi:hypothetical protein
MSEAAAPEQKTTELKFPNPIAEGAYNQLVELINDHNSKVGTLNAVKGDPQTLKETLRETSQAPEAVKARELVNKLRDQLFEAEERLDKAIKPEVDRVRADGEKEAETIEASIKELAGTIKAGVNFFTKTAGEELAAHLPKLAKAKGVSAGGGATGGRRIRGYDFTVTDPKGKTTGPVGYENLAQVAKDLVVETKTLQDGFFQAAGNPELLKDAPDTVNWKVQVGEGDKAREVSLKAVRSEEKSTGVPSQEAAKEEPKKDGNKGKAA